MKTEQRTSHIKLWILLASIMAVCLGLFGTAPIPGRAAGLVVDSPADDLDAHDKNPGDGLCADALDACTLRAAIGEANALTGADTITFAFTMTITIDKNVGALPQIDESLTIDASSVWDNGNNLPGVVIDGNGGSFSGFFLNTDANTIYGLHIKGFDGSGIYIVSSSNTVGGSASGQRNIISGNNTGVTLSGSSAKFNTIQNNYIGLAPDGMSSSPNETGILLTGGASENTIGSSTYGEGNFISGSTTNGVLIEGTNTDSNWLLSNAIGLTSDLSAPLGNGGHGVRIQNGPTNTSIGTHRSTGNYIGYNNSSGVFLADAGSGTQVIGNIIGGNNNDGVYISASVGSVVSDNIITQNGIAGVRVYGASAAGNLIWPNSITNNSGVGILLQGGGNMNISPPVIQASKVNNATGTTCSGCRVALYSDPDDEGRLYSGITTADSSGNWSYTGPLPGPFITATAIDISGNTSEFSLPVKAPLVTFIPMIIR